MPRYRSVILWAGALAVTAVATAARADNQAAVVVPTVTCAARAPNPGSASITWHAGPVEDQEHLDRWCRAVGLPLVVSAPVNGESPPELDEVVVLTWNAHLAEGNLGALIDRLRAGELTEGRPVRRFVLLLQELYRRGPDVPAFHDGMRSAHPIVPRDSRAPDARDFARGFGLSMAYVPSMRNGATMLEDRGNAIVSTEPLGNTFALELPFERQRRVAVGASIAVASPSGPLRLTFLNVHLEPLSSPSSLWVFRNPRRRQIAAILNLLRSPSLAADPQSAGIVLGGDLNTIQGGSDEDTYVAARAWSQSLAEEDTRSTHRMGRIDYLFFRLAPAWSASTVRVADKFGSDHHPVAGFFSRTNNP